MAGHPLLADAEFLNDLFVAFGIGLSEVVEQAATLADHHEKTAPGGMVLLMRLEMLRQFTNTCHSGWRSGPQANRYRCRESGTGSIRAVFFSRANTASGALLLCFSRMLLRHKE